MNMAMTHCLESTQYFPVTLNDEYQLIRIDNYDSDALGGWLAVPENIKPNEPPLIAIHGVHRNARDQAEKFAGAAAQLGRIVIAPLFSERSFKKYQQVIIKGRADIGLLTLINRIRNMGFPIAKHFDLFGYSGGAQFAHRFALFYPQLIKRLTLAGTGWYTFPDNTAYPYGLGARKSENPAFNMHTQNNIELFFQICIRVFIGELEFTLDENTRQSDQLNQQQGTNRLERAEKWCHAIQRYASKRDIKADIRLRKIVGCGHQFSEYVTLGNLNQHVFSPSDG